MRILIESLVEEIIHICDVCKEKESVGVCERCEKDICEDHLNIVEFDDCSVFFCTDCMKETSESREVINNCEKMIKLFKNKIENEYERIYYNVLE